MRPASLCPEAASVVTGLMAVILLMPWGAHAQVSTEVRPYLTSASRLYDALEYERALEQLSSARRLARGAEDDVALSLYEGAILADLGRNEEASAAFKAALVLKPEVRLPVQVSPKVEQRFEDLREQVKRELASLHAKSEAGPPPAPVNATRPGSPRSRALIPAIAGGALLVAGGVSWGLARSEQSRLRSGDPSLSSYAEAQQSISRGRSFQLVGAGLIGAGVVGLGLAAGFYVLDAPEAPMALRVGTDGTSAFLYGRWP